MGRNKARKKGKVTKMDVMCCCLGGGRFPRPQLPHCTALDRGLGFWGRGGCMCVCAPWGAGLEFWQGSQESLVPFLLSLFPSLFVLNGEECWGCHFRAGRRWPPTLIGYVDAVSALLPAQVRWHEGTEVPASPRATSAGFWHQGGHTGEQVLRLPSK